MIEIPPLAAWVVPSIAMAAYLTAPLPAHASPPVVPAGAAACAACHGANGEGNLSGVPRLAGQNAQYLEATLSKLSAGSRVSPVMQPIARGLSDAQVRELSGWYASLQPAYVPAAALPRADLVQAGQQLAEFGVSSNSRLACVSCHGAASRGNDSRHPNLAGQPVAYLVRRLHAFQALAKTKRPAPSSMAGIASQLNETQVQQVTTYFSTLQPR